MKTADFKNIILKMFGNREFYGYEIHKMLTSQGFKVEISRLYRILSEMSKEGLLQGRWEKSQIGPDRRIYKLGTNGRNELNKILFDAIFTVHSFYGMYLINLAPSVNIIDSIMKPLISALKTNENIAFVTSRYSPMNEVIVSYFHNKVPHGRIFLAKPKSVPSDLKLDDVLSMDGSYGDIPLKEDYVDLLFIIDLPEEKALGKAFKEWFRVLNKNGVLAILTPTILISRQEDPMSIGDFVEKYEHEAIEKGVRIDKEHLQTYLNNSFKVVNEKEFVHMTILIASEKR